MTARKRQTIMLVDDNQAMLSMGKKMLQEHYEVYALPSAERMFTFLGATTPDLILMDVSMPNMNGFEALKLLKADARHAEIPVIFVTSKSEETAELEGLALGAIDYVTKPYSAAILKKRIENHILIKSQEAELKQFNDNLVELVKKKTAQVTGLQNSITDTLADVIEFRDAFTGGHIIRTQKYMQLLINYLIEHETPYSAEVCTWVSMDSILALTKLHDLGKVCISDAILNKPGKLTPEEFEIMKSHAARGVEIIGKMKEETEDEHSFLHYAKIVAGTHHEKWDGSGYPAGLKRRNIPLLGRLMAIADVYDALISTRPYKKPIPHEEAIKIILKETGSHFDPILVNIFVELESEFAVIGREQD